MPAVPEELDCPVCREQMQLGRVEVIGALKPLVLDVSSPDLWWHQREPSRHNRQLLIENGSARLAWGCAECDLVIFSTAEELPASYGRPVT